MRVLLSLTLLFVAVFGHDNHPKSFETPNYHDSIHTKVFRRWKHFFNKEYSNILDEAYRFTIFAENWRYIHEVNSQHLGYTLGLNQFADLTGAQFREYVHGKSGSCLRRGEKTLQQQDIVEGAKVSAPASVDWTMKGVVTPVKNQGQCGSCWAFSTTGSIESQTAIKTGKLVSLSEQQLVDCSRSYGNQGCNGGLMDSAFKYVKAEGGLCTEEEYPYKAKDGICKAKTCGTKKDPISGYKDVTKDSSTSLVNAVAEGPVSIAIEADQSAFQFYKRGVMSGQCGTRLDHGVLVVGYGSEGGKDYWKVKNSWGETWGEEGYIRMCKDCNKNGRAGECGILEQPSYPTIA